MRISKQPSCYCMNRASPRSRLWWFILYLMRVIFNSRSKPLETATVNNSRLYLSLQCCLKLDSFKSYVTYEKLIWSSSGEVNSCLTFKLLHCFLGALPSSEKPRWPRSGPVELSRMQGITVDLIWSSMWTHKGPQLDLNLPQHAITGEPNTVCSYINS